MTSPTSTTLRHALVSGFEPFDGNLSNPSWLAVQGLPERIGLFAVTKIQLPVTFAGSFPILEKAIDACQPDLVICTGLAAGRPGISLERIAVNIDDARIPDNQGAQPIDRPIDYAAPNAYFSGLPARDIIRRLAEQGLPADISNSAGTYVCNHVMFRLLHLIACRRPAMMGGFIHVPALLEVGLPETLSGATVRETCPDQGATPGLPLAAIVRALTTAIQTCSDHFESGIWRGTKRQIVPYDPTWPRAFSDIKASLQAGLGNLAQRIDHIGSTSVPGLAAKDVIDIQITVETLDDRVLAAMTALGHTRVDHVQADHIPPGSSTDPADWRKWFFRPPPGQRPTNIHVREAGRANQRYPLLFRDFLRTQPATAAAYAELKKRLAANLANPSTYPDVKDPAVDLIHLAAERWARDTDWQQA